MDSILQGTGNGEQGAGGACRDVPWHVWKLGERKLSLGPYQTTGLQKP
ncbi:MAG: hypothetical protein RID53_32190 [Coleofasciculus sp. B1-GNL1-01]